VIFKKKHPPRKFNVGHGGKITIRDCGTVQLDPDEQITFTTPAGGEYDITRKSWGFYATPSMNARLADHGLRAGLVINSVGRMFLMLVESGREGEFYEYLKHDDQRLLSWLSTDADVKRIEQLISGAGFLGSAQRRREYGRPSPGDRPRYPRQCPMCNGTEMLVHFVYSQPPPGETCFKFTEGIDYWRELHRCGQCGHFLEHHEMDQSSFYTGDYVSATYGDQAKVKAAFERIISLPEAKSDNEGRARRILEFAEGYFPQTRFAEHPPRLLDVGSGLCVFGWRMRKAGWDVSAIDMDPKLVEHARENIGIKAFLGNVRNLEGIGAFDVITFNKVLEHIEDPASMLSSVSRFLAPDGFVYLELPDGENAEKEGQDREEYLLGHIHVFSASSAALLIQKAGFNLLELERLREPSTKFTIRAFCRPF